ncbi:hypothetical protein ACFLZM_07765 [Thermodesulfobacteriota bacterium]
MKRSIVFVSACVSIMLCISLFSFYSLEPMNAFAEGELKNEEEIKNAYIEGFIDALKFHSDKIEKFKKNELALKKEAEFAAEAYLNKIKKMKSK